MIKKILTVLIASLLLSGCDFFSEAGEKPWIGHSLNKEKNKQEFWLVFSKTREWCISEMESELGPQSKSWNKAWYSKPMGCAHRSNNLPLSIYYYETIADKSLYRCIGRWFNPKNEEYNQKYQWMLNGYSDIEHMYECIWNS